MRSILKKYLRLFKNRDFTILILVIFIGQIASAFLILALIASVFKKTGSSFGVSGVILSFALPGFFLMAVAGLVADLFDRKIIILVANIVISLVVLLILLSGQAVYASIPLAFAYFAGNTFFIPASSAATAQLVNKRELLTANSIFIFALSGGIIAGLFLAAVISFFEGARAVLLVCEGLLILAAVLSFFLPKLQPRRKANLSLITTIGDIIKSFIYIFSHPAVWFFFLSFAAVQGIIVFGLTLAPGFFYRVVGINIEKSPILIFPLIGVGVGLGTLIAHVPKLRESNLVATGLFALGLSSFALGVFLKLIGFNILFLILIVLFLVSIGMGAVMVLIASRAALQKNVAHNYQGTVFGANVILASLFTSVLSPAAATFELIWGYINILLWGGTVITLGAAVSYFVSKRWKF